MQNGRRATCHSFVRRWIFKPPSSNTTSAHGGKLSLLDAICLNHVPPNESGIWLGLRQGAAVWAKLSYLEFARILWIGIGGVNNRCLQST